MPRFAICIAAVTLTTSLLFAGSAAAAAGNPCSNSAITGGTAVREGSTWRMEVLIDEAAYRGPSLHDRLANNWNQTAKRNYRWTSVTAPVDTGVSTELMTISAVVIGDGIPVLAKGDVVDVDVVQGIDYSQGRAPVIVRRVCVARDEVCLDELRKMQEGRVAGVAIGSDYSVAGDKRFAKPPGNLSCVLQKCGRRGEVTAAVR